MILRTMQTWLLIAVAGVFATPHFDSAAADNKKESTHSVAEVMQQAMKKGEWKKLTTGEATDDEKKELIELFTDLSKSKPPRGDQQKWEEKTTELLAAAEAAAKGEKDSSERLKKAANCGACHRDHKD